MKEIYLLVLRLIYQLVVIVPAVQQSLQASGLQSFCFIILDAPTLALMLVVSWLYFRHHAYISGMKEENRG